MYYFNFEVEVRVNDFNFETKVGKIIQYKPFEKNALVEIDGKEEKVLIIKITRIL